ncbi:Uncharacterised protein [Legionella lansingensis]|uniref:Sugar 3,4-ketoisomerase QdtA cupin domain-containing protein n=1 Tax=Legionella lansingensis TaxID=45067 RepID=A0A0W0VLG7_9GAMM|nr:hypothetical protein [Legionella lansingensis]KTD20981.1 hypothetical protein Llan_1711 [Legionella lansingensis]SNV44716.1 Uncharacterised protein [Legionella lansingensis]
MNPSNCVVMKEFNLLGEDERGITQEFSLPRKQKDFIFITRKKGSISGNSYHTGKSIVTNPKTFILLSGQIEFSYRTKSAADKTLQIINAPMIIEVQPHTVHAVKALTDIILIECNSIAEIRDDIIKEAV